MNLMIALSVGILITIGIYQLMGRDMFRIAFGLYIILNALNLLIIAVKAMPAGRAPFSQLGEPSADPLLQAMVLTAIVIGFGLSTFLLLVTARIVRARKSLDARKVDHWRG